MATIAAAATPPGTGGVAIIRISGPSSLAILREAVRKADGEYINFTPRFLRHGWVKDAAGQNMDECLAVYMPGPKTFTGEDAAEIHCHASPLIVQLVLERCLELGARQAGRGEFTRRAFLSGRLDLSQAEAVAELARAPGKEALRYSLDRLSGCLAAKVSSLKEKLTNLSVQACVAIDFPEDEVPPLSREEFTALMDPLIADLDALLGNARRAAAFQAGGVILLLGPVNAGKSSLLNALCGRKRALVSDSPGTTRDFLEVSLDFNGLAVRLTDTAGLRMPGEAAESAVEALGIEQSLSLLEQSDLVWLVVDGSGSFSGLESLAARVKDKPCLVVLNKNDLPRNGEPPDFLKKWPVIAASALTGDGLEELAEQSRAALLGEDNGGSYGLAPNVRQASELAKAKAELELLKGDLEAGQSLDASLAHLDSANAILDNVLGVAAHDRLLDQIFSQFCIGK